MCLCETCIYMSCATLRCIATAALGGCAGDTEVPDGAIISLCRQGCHVYLKTQKVPRIQPVSVAESEYSKFPLRQ